MIQVFGALISGLWIVLRKMLGLFLRPEPQTLFKWPGGTRKQLRYSCTLKVDAAKAIGKKYGKSTLNDVMLSCITAGLRCVLEKQQPEVLTRDLVLRAAIPVDMRPRSSSPIRQTRNKISSLLIDLPVGEPDSIERLKRITRSTREAKFSLERQLLFTLSRWIGGFPSSWLKLVATSMSRSVSVAVSNVRGPPMLLSFCQSRAEGFAGFVPPPPGVNVGLVVFSIGQDLGLTLSTDRQTIADPDVLMHGILDEFKALQQQEPTPQN